MRLFLLAVTIAAAALAAACGGEEAPSATPTASPATATRTPATAATSPTVAPVTPTSAIAPGSSLSPWELTYVSLDGAIWLANADGTGRMKLADNPCEEVSAGLARGLTWSPDGRKLALLCDAGGFSRSLVVLDADGRLLTTMDWVSKSWVSNLRWSPDSGRLAYQFGLLDACPDLCEVKVLGLADSEDETVVQNACLLDWPLPDRILVGLNPEIPEDSFNVHYQAYWLDLNTGQRKAVPRFDDAAQFWLSPDATKAVVLTGQWSEAAGGIPLAIYNLETGEEQPIPGSAISYPGEGIPPTHLAISTDGSKLYRANPHATTAIFRANMDGSGLTKLGSVPSKLGSVPSMGVKLSTNGLVAYRSPAGPGDVPSTIVAEDLESGAHAEIWVGEGFPSGTIVWRPTPSAAGTAW